MALKIEDNLQMLMNDGSKFARSYRKFFSIDQSVVDFIESATEESMKQFFTEQRSGKVTDFGLKVLLAIVYTMSRYCLDNFLGPNEKARKARIAQGDLDVFLDFCAESAIDALKGSQTNNSGGTGYDANRARSLEQIYNGYQRYYSGYLNAKCSKENRDRADDNANYHPDQAVKDEEDISTSSWDAIASNSNSFTEKDYDLIEKLKTFKAELDEDDRYPLASIFADLLNGKNVDELSAKYGMAKNTIYYKIMGKNGLVLDSLERNNIDLKDLAYLMRNEPDTITNILAA